MGLGCYLLDETLHLFLQLAQLCSQHNILGWGGGLGVLGGETEGWGEGVLGVLCGEGVCEGGAVC